MLQTLETKPSKKKIRKKTRSQKGSAYETSSDETIPPKPTLQIKKREGAYWITMNPLKDPQTLEDNENPYMECEPMQFKIVKKKEEDDEYGCSCADEESSDSELDIEFTPPAGVIHPDRLKRKKNVVHIDTQYNLDDIKDNSGKGKKGKGKGKDKKGKGGKGGKGGGKGKKGGKKKK